MILEDFILLLRVNKTWFESGLDTVESCLDLRHFKNYPWEVVYSYNSRGFRDQEWPDDLKSAIWCIGDSFTMGLGSPLSHSWPKVLEQNLNQRCINISLDGGSNDWISRKAVRVLEEIKPSTVVLQWSFVERRENNVNPGNNSISKNWYEFYQSVRDASWPDCVSIGDFPGLPVNIQEEILNDFLPHNPLLTDEQLRLGAIPSTDLEDIENLLQCMQAVEAAAGNTVVIHTFIPEFIAPGLEKDFLNSPLMSTLKHIGPITKLDLARDGFHYDIKTASELCERIIKLM
jgi:hypothetical protein